MQGRGEITQKNAIIEKKKVEWDGEEIPGLIGVEEIKFENKTVDVTDFSEEHTVDSNIMKVPPVIMKYRIDADTKTLEFFENFHLNKEVKDGTIIRTDAYGVEVKRYLMKDCSCFAHNIPAYDSDSPQPATISITVNPWKIIPVAAA